MSAVDLADARMYVPPAATIARSQLTAFTRFCERETQQSFVDDRAFACFSVDEHERFWSLFLRWSALAVDGAPTPVCTDPIDVERAVFFPELRLSYFDSLLGDQSGPADALAIVACHASGAVERLTRGELRTRALAVAAGYRSIGLRRGDRVVAIARNNAEVIVAALGAAAIGATFSSAAPEMGPVTIATRFEQLEPDILLANLTNADGTAAPELVAHVGGIARGLPSLRAVVALDDGQLPYSVVPRYRLSELERQTVVDEAERMFPFNHPLFVLFSSGTTGPPKGIVHGAGGTLLEHVKEHRLHTDIRAGDLLFYQTSLAWMMWNWQLSALASGAGIVCYDGAVTSPEALWNIVASERVTVFGTNPAYLQLCEELGYSPSQSLDISSLRAVLSTGSILHDRQYDWVRAQVGDLPLQSISGGTDIVGCFMLGQPNLPVERGTIQCRSLGLDVQSLATSSTPRGDGIGELVCCNPFPSRPLGFVGDPDGARFHSAYFAEHPGVWTHGDLVEIDELGRVRVHGRSDGVLNVNGVRIGPAEIYRVLSEIPEILEGLAVEQERACGSRIVLFVVLREPGTLDDALVALIRRELARNASPMHVPNAIVEVDELPRTHSGKRSERAARDAVNRGIAANVGALANPQSLDGLCRALQLADTISECVDADNASTEARMRVIWEDVLGIAPIGPDENFFDVGGTSLGALRLLGAIHDRLGVDLPLSAMMHSATTRILSALVDGSGLHDLELAVPLRAGTGGRPLFIVHGLLGDIFELRWLVARIDTPRPIYGLRSLGLDPRFEAHTGVGAMADEYIHQVRKVQPVGPYAISGYSFGGLVAFEMARRLLAAGEEVDRLVLFDAYVDHHALPPVERTVFLARRVWRLSLAGLRSPGDKVPRLVRRTAGRLARRLPVEYHVDDDVQMPPLIRSLERANTAAFEAYVPGSYPGHAIFFRANERDPHHCDPLPIWSRVAAQGLTVECIPSDHLRMLEEPCVGEVARRLATHLGDGRVTDFYGSR